MKRTILALALLSGSAGAYEPETHRQISRAAAGASHLHTILRDRFGDIFGLGTVVDGRSASGWATAAPSKTIPRRAR